MHSYSRVQLSSIPSLTFYKDELTTSRRTAAISQLNCVGKPCNLYTPDVVRCENVGGTGTEVDWKCQADLPSKLRFGRTDVSCEGWQGPGDNYVLKGSCSLTYRLVYVPDGLHDSEPSGSWMPYHAMHGFDLSKILFSVLWFAVLAWLAWRFVGSCLRTDGTHRRPPSNRPPTSGFGGNWFNGGRPNTHAPPPPYTKYPSNTSNEGEGWRPGFWTGAALGGLGAHMLNQRNRQRNEQPQAWDWERPRPAYSPTYRRSESSRGEGSSNLGSMRTSTGMGGSTVR